MIKVLYPNYRETVTEKVEFIKFSGGEWHVNIKDRFLDKSNIIITARLDSSDSVFQLLVLTDALKRKFKNKIQLVIPYLPYSRQDRVCTEGDAFSLKVFADIINAQDYVAVITADSHSSAASLLINNFIEIPQSYFVSKIKNGYWDIILSPDLGASKKTEENQKLLGIPEIGYCIKKRDPKTGSITSTEVLHPDIRGKKILITDDICDGGRTFIEITKVLKQRGAYQTDLYVTHAILSKGLGVLLNNGINKVYTTDSFLFTEATSPSVEIIHRFF